MQHDMPILMLPGLMNDARVWGNIRDALGARRHLVVAPTHTADTISELAASALVLMPPGRFAVAGFSLGGYVAMEVARQAQSRISGIALISTGARADSEEATQNRKLMVAALGSGDASFAHIASGFLPRLVHASRVHDRELLELLRAMATEVGSEGFVRQQKASMNRSDSRDMLRRLNCPALVLCGREDQITPPELSEEMAALLSGNVTQVLVPECGHMSTLEQPGVVVDAFLRWIEQVDATAL